MENDVVRSIQGCAKRMRRNALLLTHSAGSAHVGPGLSAIEICAALYLGIMKHDPKNPALLDRDRFILSKGHGVLALYTILYECGYYDEKTLFTFEKEDTHLAGHPCAKGLPGLEFPTGSMGHGLSVGAGMAKASKISKIPYNVYVVTGDGELNEGSNWEAVMFAKHHKLDNLCVVVDANGFQHDSRCCDVMDVGNIAGLFSAHGWNALEVDGHDAGALLRAFRSVDHGCGRPTAVVAHTVKGKGVSFIENNNAWHSAAITKEQMELALSELS